MAMCELSLLINEDFMNSLNQGFVWGNSTYKKLWDLLDNREKTLPEVDTNIFASFYKLSINSYPVFESAIFKFAKFRKVNLPEFKSLILPVS